MSKSNLEAGFAGLWARFGNGEEPVRELRFSKPRRFRFDFAWPEHMVAVEMEGGTWTGGRHTRGKGFQSDCEKYNLAVCLGWRVLRYTANDLKDRPLQMVDEIKELL